MKKLFTFLVAITGGTMSQAQNAPLTITQLTGDFYTYVTWQPVGGSPYPSNSMYLVTKKGVVLFDTPWDSTQFQPLLDSIEAKHHKKVLMCISTHFHDDRTAGVNFLNAHGVSTWSLEQTRVLCRTHGNPIPAHAFTKDTTFEVGGFKFRAIHPGEGHAPDNIVVWFANEKVLYGGCLIKSTETNSIGNLSDANVAAWPATIRKLIEECPDPKYVIPGHLGGTDKSSLQHTIDIAEKEKENKK